MIIKIKKLYNDAVVPQYAHKGDAGADFFSYENHILRPGETYKFKTGIAMEIPEGYVGLVWDKSGFSSKNSVHRLAGVVDSIYRGEILIALHNLSNKEKSITKGQKIAQMLIQKVEAAEFQLVEELSETSRGEDGFGSTGI